MKEENPMVECLVQLKAKKVKGFLSILCENSLRDSQVRYLRENATLETSKEDKKNHGFGVKNIKSVVKDYSVTRWCLWKISAIFIGPGRA